MIDTVTERDYPSQDQLSKSVFVKIVSDHIRIPGSRSTNATSFMVISGGPRGSSDAIEIDEEDEAGEEDIVSLIFPNGLEGVEFSRWYW